jgi:TPR repeat protein
VKQNHEMAAMWVVKAAEQGNAEAQYRLGHMYYDGKGVKQNRVAAVMWFVKAAEQGNAAAHSQCYARQSTTRQLERAIGQAFKDLLELRCLLSWY